MSAVAAASVPDATSSKATDHFQVVATHNHGQNTFKCNYCNKTFKGTGTRCYVHLTGENSDVSQCMSVPAAVVNAVKAAKAAKTAEKTQKRKAEEDIEQRRRDRASSSAASAAAPGSGSSRPAGAAPGAVSIQHSAAHCYMILLQHSYCLYTAVLTQTFRACLQSVCV
jgi:hypothetical protein